MGKIFGKPYAKKFVEGLSSDAKASFAAALDDNGDFLRVDLDLGPTALQETYDEDACAKCALSFGGKELQGIICYTSETAYDFVSYEPQDEIRFWEIDAETCEITEILTHEKVTLGDLRLALGAGSGGLDPADVPEGDILQSAVLGLNADGEAVKGNLFGKYVRISEAFESSTLTDDQINMLKDGVFMQGEFLGLHNPVFFPCQLNYFENRYGGVALSFFMNQNVGIYMYEIVISSKTISVTPFITKNIGQNYSTSIPGIVNIGDGTSPNCTINGSKWPQERVPQTNNRRIVWKNGTPEWIEGNGLYLHTIVFDVGLSQTFTIRLISDSATACAKDTTSGNFGIDGATFINRANMDNIVLRPFGANQFNPDVYAFDTATGTFSNAITLATVESDTVTPIG